VARKQLAVVLALAAVGVVRTAYFHFAVEGLASAPVERTRHIDDRYAQVAAALPPHARVGYLTDLDLEQLAGARRYEQALYSLAPRLLASDDGRAPVVLADLSGPQDWPAWASSRGLRIVATAGPVAALARGTASSP
jgi:hypothetical protein